MRTILVALAALGCASRLTAAADPFEFKDGDRVVLVGSTLIEREQKYGYWELFLTLKNRDKNVTFRNLGWSGDTVAAEARGRFDYANLQKCFEQLTSLVKELKPTVVVICYGQNESFEGKAGVEKFTKGLEKLIDAIADTKARVVLLSPTPFSQSPGFADAEKRNADLALYVAAMKAVAERRQLDFMDLFNGCMLRDKYISPDSYQRMTDNGIHLTPDGYRSAAMLLVRTAGFPDAEALREKIVEKNQLFFYRWRPQNETYLFGFRKHEQGKNGAEVAQFDPLVAEAEKQIAELKKDAK